MSPTWIANASGSASMRRIISTNRGSSRSLYGVSPITPKTKPRGEGGDTAHDAPASESATNAALIPFIGELAQAVQGFERLARRELVGLDAANCFGERIGRRCRGARLIAEKVRRARTRPQLLLQLGEVPARRPHH